MQPPQEIASSQIPKNKPGTQAKFGRRGVSSREDWAYLLTFTFALVLVAFFLRWHIASLYQREMDYWQSRQTSIAFNQSQRIDDWLKERQGDAQVLSVHPSVRSLLVIHQQMGGNATSRPDGAGGELEVLDETAKSYSYAGVYILDRDGKVVLQSQQSIPFDPQFSETCRTAARTGVMQMALIGDAPTPGLMGFSAPVFLPGDAAQAGQPAKQLVGVVLLVSDASRTLFPLVTREGVPTRTAETLLVGRNGDDAVYLSPLRFTPSSGQYPQRPLSEFPAARSALNGGGEFLTNLDYRDVPVLAATQFIPRTGWGLIRKIDRAEALESYHRSVVTEGLAAILLIVLLGGLVLFYRRGILTRVLAQEQERFRALLESAPDAAVVLNADARIVFVNAAAERMFGYGREELLGEVFTKLMPERFRTERLDYYTRLFSHPEGNVQQQQQEGWALRKDASEFPVEVARSTIRTLQGEVIAVSLRDVTERKRAERELRLANRALLTLSGCNQALVRATSEAHLLDQVCAILVHESGYRMAWVGFREPDEARSIRPISHAGFEDGYLQTANITWADNEHGQGPTGTAIRTGKTVIARDVQADPSLAAWREEAIKRGYASSIALPILVRGQAIGALTIYAGEADAFDSDEVRLLTELSNDLAYGIQALRTKAERERAEEQLRLTQFSLEHASDPVFWIDPQGRLLYINEAACRSLDRSQEELLSLSMPDINPTLTADTWKGVWEELKANGSGTYETCHRTKAGRIVPVEVTSTYLQFGGKEYAFAFARDITERKQAAEALQREKAFTEAVIDSFPDVFFVIRSTGEFLHWGRNPERYLGYSQEETMAMESAVEIVAEEDRALAAQKIQAAFTEGSIDVEIHLLHRDGRKIPYLLRATRAVIGEEVFLVGFGLNITERKRANEELRASEERFRTVFENAGIAIALVDMQGHVFKSNPALCHWLGYHEEEFQRTAFVEYTHPEDRDKSQGSFGQLTTGNIQAYTMEKRYLKKGGGVVWGSVTASMVRDAHGRPDYVVGMVQDITERKLADERVKASEEKFRKAFMTGVDVFYISTLNEGKIIEVNDSVQPVLGYTREEMIGKTVIELGIFADPADRLKIVSETEAKGFVKNLELRGRKKDGTPMIGLLSVNLLQGDDEQLILGVIRDITAQKHAEQALRQSEAKLKDALLAAKMGAWELQVDTGTITWDHNLNRIAGRDPNLSAPRYQELSQVYVPESWQRVQTAVQNCLATGAHYELDLEMLRPDGSRRWVTSRGEPLRDANGRITQIYGTVQDITDRKEAEKALLEAESEYRKIFEGAMEGVFRTSFEGKCFRANPALAQMLGYDSAQELISTMNDVAHQLWLAPGDRARYVALAQEHGIVRGFECQHRRKDGTVIWVSLNSRLIRDADGLPLYFDGFMEDITERKRAEEVLRKSEAELKEAQRIAHLGTWLMDVNTGEAAWSTEVYHMLGLDPLKPPPPGPEHIELFTQESWTRLSAALDQAVRAGVPYELELETVRPNGSRGWILNRGEAVRDAAGAITHLRGVVMDITERRHLEDQFRQAQKMEAVGQLAGGVAHDFNNLLTIINGYAQLLLEISAPDDRRRGQLEQILDAGERAASLTRQLLAFSRKQVIEPRVLDLNGVLKNTEKMLRRLIGEDVRLKTVLGPELGQVKADPAQVEQVIMNLAVNARDAMPRGGSLIIETSNTELDASYALAHAEVTPGNYVMVAVSDTGFGMNAATLSHIFEPFFTTKEAGKGTGLGLATVHGIVKQAGGHIAVYSEVGRGTTFRIYFPRLDRPIETTGVKPTSAVNLSGSETILLVEDEPMVLLLIREALEPKGYRVLVASRPEEALTIFESHSGAIHLLLTDVIMPGYSGKELADQLLLLRPQMKVLFISGYTADAIAHHGVLDPGIAFLPKPFTSNKLLRKVRAVLDQAE